MKRVLACLVLAAGCSLALASDIPPPRPVSEVQRVRLDERFAKRGEVDLLVASTAALNWPPEDNRLWLPAAELGLKAVTLADMKGDRKPKGGPTWFVDFPTYRATMHPALVRTDGEYTRTQWDKRGQLICVYDVAVQAPAVSAEAHLSGFAMSRGPVNVKLGLANALVLATGDVTAARCTSSVVICDGDVRFPRGARQSLIIARGKIELGGKSDSCTLIAGGKVAPGQVPVFNIPPPLKNDPRSAEFKAWRERMRQMEIAMVFVKDREPNPLGFITFFELHRVGLEVKADEGAVRVAKVAAGKACEKAGVKAGDTVLEVGGKKPADAESLRRLLRDALAVGDAAVKLKRGNQSLTVKLSLPE